MNIKTKLILGFCIVLFVMFAIAGLGMNRSMTAQNSVQELYDHRYEGVRFSNELLHDLLAMSKAIDTLLLMDSPENEAVNMEKLRVLTVEINRQLDKAAVMFDDNDGKKLVTDLIYHGRLFLNYKDDVKNLYSAGLKNEAHNLRARSGAQTQEQFLLSIQELIKLQEQEMDGVAQELKRKHEQTHMYSGVLTGFGLLLGLGIMLWIVVSLSKGLRTITGIVSAFAGGSWNEYHYQAVQPTNDEFGRLIKVFNRLANDLQQSATKERTLFKVNEETAWLQTNNANMYAMLHEADTVEQISTLFISELARLAGAHSGALYVLEQDEGENFLRLTGTYSPSLGASRPAPTLKLGEGWIGQCALDGKPIIIEDVPAHYLSISSAFGEIAPVSVNVYPVIHEGEIIAVFELNKLKRMKGRERKFIQQIPAVFGTSLTRLQGRLQIEELLRVHQTLSDELQCQSEELMSQQEELKASNEKLKRSEELLQQQQAELEQMNEALMVKTAELEEQVKNADDMNVRMEIANMSLEKQAMELAVASRYKSEFLANMSHELRTPLNSLLILSQLLKENEEGNLTKKQVEFASTIYSSGCDLLKLIDDVLDLSKVESGRLRFSIEPIEVNDLVAAAIRQMEPVARDKEILFETSIADDVPALLHTDASRVHQILKNLLSNAFKFTDQGIVRLTVQLSEQQESGVAFIVEDTGIGIAPEKQAMIFEAFRQADGTTSRKYGGTGLGLSISRQLAQLLGGSIVVTSQEGKGSTFTLTLPIEPVHLIEHSQDEAAAAKEDAASILGAGSYIDTVLHSGSTKTVSRTNSARAAEAQWPQDDRDHIASGDKVLLIVEDDMDFAQILLDMAHARSFKVLLANQGDVALELAKQYGPDAILLDIQLPVLDGWSVLVKLKNDAATRHIPVHVISVADEIHQGLSMGAIAWLRKPSSKESLEEAFAHVQTFIDRDLRELLIVQENEEARSSLIELIAHDDVRITAVAGGEEALHALQRKIFDCMVLDYGITAPNVYSLLDRLKENEAWRRLPIIIYTGAQLDKKEQMRLKKYAESIIVKDVKSPERLLDETALFLHRVEERLPDPKKRMLQKLHNHEEVFSGKKVLLVDDDIRNVFAVSNLLEALGMQVSFAETGRQALDLITEGAAFDIVLMDIMMPEMDGYEAMQRIRSLPDLDKLPIIALTAKAMKDDRDKCIAAGANDYITKPVHKEQLLSLMRVWLC